MLAPGQITLDRALEVTVARRGASGFFFDFDGTLAPIQNDPDTVQLTDGVREPLERLSHLVSRVAIVSARPVTFLESRFGDLTQVALFGLYGLEARQPGLALRTDPAAFPWIETIRRLAERAREELPQPVRVEYKRLSVALHYRSAPEHRHAVEAWAGTQAQQLGLKRQDGRMVVELKPPVERDKGEVIGSLIKDLTCAWYFGDDLGDIPAFSRLREHMLSDAGFVGIRVVVANPETGTRLIDQADLRVDSPDDMPPLLTTIADALRR
jgi:trehalose 6-phosphate phosphatase